jgi:hypothetical protein
MLDVELARPLTVNTEGTAGPYLMVAVTQLSDVEKVLADARVPYSVSRDAVRVNGHEAVALIDFGRRANAASIQALLDAH